MDFVRAAGSTMLLLAALAASAPEPLRAQPLPPEGGGQTPPPATLAKKLQDCFRGRVVSFQGRRAEIAYDFQDPAQVQDWAHTHPFVRPPTSGGWRVDAKALRGDGNAGWRHRATFDGEVRIKATISSEDAKNFGLVVLDEDRSQFDIFAVSDTFFALLDRKLPLRHMLATFQPAGEGPGASTEWREVQVGYDPRISSEPFEISVRKKGAMNEFRFGNGGRLAGADKQVTVVPRLAIAFYTLGARVVVSKAVVSGVLDAKWLREQGIAVEGETPADPEPMEGEKKGEPPPPPGGEAKPGAAPGPATDWQAAARKLGDAGASKEDRERALEDLIASKERRALRGLIDLMYREEDALGRDLAARAFKAISGRETGFRGDASKEARKAAMPRVWDAWYQVQEQIEKDERKKEKQP